MTSPLRKPGWSRAGSHFHPLFCVQETYPAKFLFLQPMAPAAATMLRNSLKISELWVIWDAQVRQAWQPPCSQQQSKGCVLRWTFCTHQTEGIPVLHRAFEVVRGGRPRGQVPTAICGFQNHPNPSDKSPSQKSRHISLGRRNDSRVEGLGPGQVHKNSSLSSPCHKSLAHAAPTSTVARVRAFSARRFLRHWVLP